MIKYIKTFITIILAFIAFGAYAQSTATTSSPYSQYGLGDILPSYLPQNSAMGGIATAINKISFYNNINPLNPASYGAINLTTIDAGIYSNVQSFSQIGQTSISNSNFRFSHVAFAIPVSKHSALSFGLLPYSQMGYNNIQTKKGFGSSPTPGGSPQVDTNAVNYINYGEGGLSKAYLGYGFRIGKHLLIGANVSYIFGNLQQYSATEFPALYGTLNSQIENNSSIGGVNYDYGVQYSVDFGQDINKHLIFGYAASANTSINSTDNYIVSQYTYTSSGVKNIATDSLVNDQSNKSKIKLPQINHFGISYQYDGHYLIGADFTTGNWSSLSINGVNQGFQNSKTFNIGGEIIPNIQSLRNYFARMDYRAGFMYDQSYLNFNNTNIQSYAFTFGLGFPLAPNNVGNTFYKINFGAEVGQRGTVADGLVKEKFVTLHLSFTLNDRWFQKYKFL